MSGRLRELGAPRGRSLVPSLGQNGRKTYRDGSGDTGGRNFHVHSECRPDRPRKEWRRRCRRWRHGRGSGGRRRQPCNGQVIGQKARQEQEEKHGRHGIVAETGLCCGCVSFAFVSVLSSTTSTVHKRGSRSFAVVVRVFLHAAVVIIETSSTYTVSEAKND